MIIITLMALMLSGAYPSKMTCSLPYQKHYGYIYSNRSTDVYFFLNRDKVVGNVDRKHGAFSYAFSGNSSGLFELEKMYPNIDERSVGFFVEVCSAPFENSINKYGPYIMEIDRIRIISEYDMTDMIAQYFDDLGLPEAIERFERQDSGSD